MHELAAAMGVAQLRKLDTYNKIRMEIANKYRQGLSEDNSAYLIPEYQWPEHRHVYHQFVIRLKTLGNENRDRVRKRLFEKHGIETGVHYPKAIPRQPVFRKQFKGECNEYRKPISGHRPYSASPVIRQ